MKVLKNAFVLIFVIAAVCFARPVFADEQLGSDNMGNGAEYDNTEDRSLAIDENGDGNYNTGEGSIVDESGSSAGSDDGSSGGSTDDSVDGSSDGSDDSSDSGSGE